MGGRAKRQRTEAPVPDAQQRAASLADCGLVLDAALLRSDADSCARWSGAQSALRCAACGAGPGTHALLDTRRHDGRAPAGRRAYLALREAQALTSGFAGGSLEARLTTHAARITLLLRALAAAAGGATAALAEQAAALLPAASGAAPAAAARAALRIAALLDSAYAELFIADCLAPEAASIPPPHIHLAARLPALAATACSECAPASAAVSAPNTLLCAACTARNPQLAYIRLRHAEASGPLQLCRLAAASLAEEGASPGQSEGTMRGCDPQGCDTLRLWQGAVRDRVAAWSAFACPDAAAARAVAAFAAAGSGGGGRQAKLLEVGAGTGYWAAYLAAECPDLAVTAHDVRPTAAASAAGGGASNAYHGSLPAWHAVRPGDAAAVAAAAAADALREGRHASPPTLLLCYPPPCLSATGRHDMALAAVTAFAAAGGKQLALVGEWRGDTGSAALERQLAACWALHAPAQALPGYANTCASLTLWRHVGAGASHGGGHAAPHPWPLACVACGAAPPLPDATTLQGPPFLRDRLTRAVVACSQACARSPAALAALEAELAARHLPPLRRGAVGAAGCAFAWADGGAALGKRVWRSAALL